jgi:hypothetical protein
MSGGCGGGSSSNDESAKYSGYMSFTQEELNEFVDRANLPLEYEELVTSDGTSIKDLIEAHSPFSINSLAKDGTSRSTSSRGVSAEEVAAFLSLMQERAWELSKPFPDGQILSTNHDGTIINQDRYVYVFPYFNEEYGRLDIPIHQYPATSSKSNNYRNPDERCKHAMYGMDCVGFIYQTALAVGVQKMGGKWGVGAMDLATATTWNAILNNDLVIAEDVVNPTDNPQPGDIIAWQNEKLTHVGILVTKENGELGLIHSIGSTNYTCTDYYNAVEDKKKGKNIANGPKVSRYSDAVSQWGKEQRRVHFRVVGGSDDTTPPPFQPDDEFISKTTGRWRVVNWEKKVENSGYSSKLLNSFEITTETWVSREGYSVYSTSQVKEVQLVSETGTEVCPVEGWVLCGIYNSVNGSTSLYESLFSYTNASTGEELTERDTIEFIGSGKVRNTKYCDVPVLHNGALIRYNKCIDIIELEKL